MGEPPPYPLGRDQPTGPWQRTGAVSEGGRAHPVISMHIGLCPFDKDIEQLCENILFLICGFDVNNMNLVSSVQLHVVLQLAAFV